MEMSHSDRLETRHSSYWEEKIKSLEDDQVEKFVEDELKPLKKQEAKELVDNDEMLEGEFEQMWPQVSMETVRFIQDIRNKLQHPEAGVTYEVVKDKYDFPVLIVNGNDK